METFEGTIVVNDGGGARVEVQGGVITALGGGGRIPVQAAFDIPVQAAFDIPVQAAFDGVAYRGSIASMGGCMALGILKSIRTELGKGEGDRVTVTLERDAAERTVDVPDDFAAASREAELREVFGALSFSHRREHVNAINDAKRPETRVRRISKALETLRAS